MRYLIKEAWESYKSEVIPEDAPPIQFEECRRAFYGGACAMFFGLLGILEPGEEPTEDDMRKVDDINAELNDFYRESQC